MVTGALAANFVFGEGKTEERGRRAKGAFEELSQKLYPMPSASISLTTHPYLEWRLGDVAYLLGT